MLNLLLLFVGSLILGLFYTFLVLVFVGLFYTYIYKPFFTSQGDSHYIINPDVANKKYYRKTKEKILFWEKVKYYPEIQILEGDYDGLEEDEKGAIEKGKDKETGLPKGIKGSSSFFSKTKFIIVIYIFATLFSFLNLIYQSNSISLF